jgi:hypothetical protein
VIAQCHCRLTIVGGVRDAPAAWRLGRWEIVRPRRHRAWVPGPSTSPLDGMRQTDTPQPITLEAYRLRRLLMWAHLALGVVALLLYLYTRLGHLPWWTPYAGARLILSPVVWPYGISALACWHLDTWETRDPGPLRVIGFIILLTAGGVLVDAALLGAFGNVERPILFGLLLAQTVAYVGAAQWMIDFV